VRFFFAALLAFAQSAGPAQSAAEVSLREYTDRRVDDMKAILDARLDAMDLAISVNASALTDRLSHSNGLIEQMRQQALDFSRKAELQSIAERVEALEQRRSAAEGEKQGGEPLVAIGMLALGAGFTAALSWAIARKHHA
jgi:hypothetical protein